MDWSETRAQRLVLAWESHGMDAVPLMSTEDVELLLAELRIQLCEAGGACAEDFAMPPSLLKLQKQIAEIGKSLAERTN